MLSADVDLKDVQIILKSNTTINNSECIQILCVFFYFFFFRIYNLKTENSLFGLSALNVFFSKFVRTLTCVAAVHISRGCLRVSLRRCVENFMSGSLKVPALDVTF